MLCVQLHIPRFYDEREFATEKKLTHKFGDKIYCAGFMSSVYKFWKALGSDRGKYQ